MRQKKKKRDIEIKKERKKKHYRLTNNLNFIIKNLSRFFVENLPCNVTLNLDITAIIN